MSEPAPARSPAYDEPELASDAAWQRLDPRMLLVHPVRELLRYLPAVLAALVLGSSTGYGRWTLAALAVPVAVGLLRYLTTRFRIHQGRVELRQGLVNRSHLAAPLDRVRTVDLSASLIHRVLGLTIVRIGTGEGGGTGRRGRAGKDHTGIDLDALPVARAHELRRELLHRAESAPAAVVGDAPTSRPGRPGAGASRTTPAAAPAPPGPWVPSRPPVSPPDDVVFRFRPVWLRYAPLTSTGWVVAAAALGGLSQLLNSVDAWSRLAHLDVPAVSWWLLGAVVVAGVVVTVTVLAVGSSALTNLGFTLTRTSGLQPGWDVRRGLLTTRETSIDAARVRGVTQAEPLALRLVGAGRLTAVVTGLDRSQRGSAVLVPPAPRAVVAGVGQRVLAAGPALTGPLRSHGVRATRRRWTRSLVPALLVAALVVAVVLAASGPTVLLALAVLPLLAGVGLAVDRARGLGHRLDPGWLTLRSGSLARRRTTLQTSGIIGWTLRTTWFQRRVGLRTLVATTAGGRQGYAVLDLPDADAVRLADAATPGLLTPFLTGPSRL